MQKKSIISSDDLIQFNLSLNRIVSSIIDLASVYENFVPEELTKYGLKNSIQQLCSNIELENTLKIALHFEGEFTRLETDKEIILFKIFNALATLTASRNEVSELKITVAQFIGRFTFSITDNGSEFNITNLSGSGLKEIALIKSLIESISGNISFSKTDDNLNLTAVDIKI